MNPRAIRSWLYAPAHQPHIVAKALASGSDAVVVDLEDAVPATEKASGRECLLDLVDRLPHRHAPVWVRINDPRTDEGQRDLDALTKISVSGVRIPKAEDTGVIEEVATLGYPLQLILETATGLLNAPHLANAHPLVETLSLGEADLSADLRVGSAAGLGWARGWVVAAARSAGLRSPIQSVYTNVADIEGLLRTTLEGAALGFLGRSVIHPRQILPVHQAMRPTAERLRSAREVVAAAEDAASAGKAAVLDARGRFVDPAVVAQAQVTLDLAALDDHPASSASSTNEGANE